MTNPVILPYSSSPREWRTALVTEYLERARDPENDRWKLSADRASLTYETSDGGKKFYASMIDASDFTGLIQQEKPNPGETLTQVERIQEAEAEARAKARRVFQWRVLVVGVIAGSALYSRVFRVPMPLIGSTITPLKWGSMAGALWGIKIRPFQGTKETPKLPRYLVPIFALLHTIVTRRGLIGFNTLLTTGMLGYCTTAWITQRLEKRPREYTAHAIELRAFSTFSSKLREQSIDLSNRLCDFLLSPNSDTDSDWDELCHQAEALVKGAPRLRQVFAFPQEIFDTQVLPVCERILAVRDAIKTPESVDKKLLEAAYRRYVCFDDDQGPDLRALLELADAYVNPKEGDTPVRNPLLMEQARHIDETRRVGLGEMNRVEYQMLRVEARWRSLDPKDSTIGVQLKSDPAGVRALAEETVVARSKLASLEKRYRTRIETFQALKRIQENLSLEGATENLEGLIAFEQQIVRTLLQYEERTTELLRALEAEIRLLTSSNPPNSLTIQRNMEALAEKMRDEALFAPIPIKVGETNLSSLLSTACKEAAGTLPLDEGHGPLCWGLVGQVQGHFIEQVRNPILEQLQRFAIRRHLFEDSPGEWMGNLEAAERDASLLGINIQEAPIEEVVQVIERLRNSVTELRQLDPTIPDSEHIQNHLEILAKTQRGIAKQAVGIVVDFESEFLKSWVHPFYYELGIALAHYRQHEIAWRTPGIAARYRNLSNGLEEPKAFVDAVFKQAQLSQKPMGIADFRVLNSGQKRECTGQQRELFHAMMDFDRPSDRDNLLICDLYLYWRSREFQREEEQATPSLTDSYYF